MRRKDREVTEIEKIESIIESCDCCRLGFADEGEVYIVPLNFVYVKEKNAFYFHSAKEGRKIELIRKTGKAGFELDTNHQLKKDTESCSYTFHYQSVIGSGKVELVTEMEEKKQAMELFMQRFTGQKEFSFQEKMLERLAIIKLEIEKISCKENK